MEIKLICIFKKTTIMRIILIVFLFGIKTVYSQEGGKVNDQFLKAIVNIKVDTFSGTGFMIGCGRESNIKYFLITNKHMIGSWSMVDSFIPAKEITVTLYRDNDKVHFFDIKIPILDHAGKLNNNILIHQDQSVDIACIYLNDFLLGVEKKGFKTFDTSFLCPLESIKKTTYIGLGSQVFAIGYPANLMITKSNEPIVKSGYIASSFSGDLNMKEKWKTRSNKIILSTNKSRYFLVDGLIIPGNSGGPVLSPIIGLFFENGHVISQNPPIQNRIIGIVSYIKPNTGISTIYAADYILELIRNQILQHSN